jgi:hypothetical protein
VWVCDRSMMFNKRLSKPPGCWRATELEDVGVLTSVAAGASKTVYALTADGGCYAWSYSAFPLAPPVRVPRTGGMHIVRMAAAGGPEYTPLLIGWEVAVKPDPSPKTHSPMASPMLSKALSLLSHIDQALELPPRARGDSQESNNTTGSSGSDTHPEQRSEQRSEKRREKRWRKRIFAAVSGFNHYKCMDKKLSMAAAEAKS